jgi:enamine deaminase RidA (YjgF/YER057c/UK114 family)
MPTDQKRRIARIRSPQVVEPPDGRFSNCLMVDGVAYIAGMTSRDRADAYAQAKIVFGKIKQLVESAGGTLRDVVKINVYVTDINEREGFWKARQEFFSGDFPTATVVQVVALADPAYKIEIEAIAHIGAGGTA